MKKELDFLSGKILPTLLRFAFPVLLALFLQALYGAVDLWAVGRFASSADMSAVSTGSQILLVLTGFITGLCMGVTVLLGQKIGEKDKKGAARVLGGTLWLLLLVGVLLSMLLLFFAEPFASLCKVPTEAMEPAKTYLRICGGGTIFIAAYNGISGVLRGMGNSKVPLYFVGIACVSNIVCDTVLIAVFHLGAAGAAIATVFSQALSVVLSMVYFYLKRNSLPICLTKSVLQFHKATILDIVKLGLPVAFSEMSNEICYLILIGFTNTLGVTVAAGVGVAEKLILFLLLIPMAYMSSISAFVAQNIGAGEEKRATTALRQGMLTSLLLGGAASTLLFFGGRGLSMLFNHTPAVLDASALFLKATALECLILSVAYCFSGYFNGCGKTKFVMAQGLCSICLVKLPSAYLALRYAENKLIFIGLSNVWGALFLLLSAILYFIRLQRKQRK